MKRKSWKAVPLLALPVFIFAGCATQVRFDAQRPPNLNTTGIQRVAVAPFATAVSGAGQIAQDLTSNVTSRLQATGAFELVSYDAVRAAMARGDAENFADAVLRGRVTHFATNTVNRQRQEQYRRPDGTTATRVVHFQVRDVEVSFEYYFVRTRDGSVVGPVRRVGQTSATSDVHGNLTDGQTLARNIITNQLRFFYRDVAPHTITISRTMQRESDRDLRGLMNAANASRRAGDYLGSREAYIAIWNNHRSIPAAINAAILFEATGELEDGIFFMEQVFEATRAPQVLQKLTQLNREVSYLLGLEALAGGGRSPAEVVANHAVGEISGILPTTPRLWIHPTANQPLVNDVIDNMISAFLGAGVTIVDRQMIDLVLLEQNLHLDGAVADSDFVSIGNLAGANTVVTVGMIGTGAARRLQVRVLDIETATLRMQSGTGVAWRL